MLLVELQAAAGTGVSSYPTAQNGTYVKATSNLSADYYPYFATDPAKSLTGPQATNEWVSAGGTIQNRIHIDLGSAKVINKIYYENHHTSGTIGNYGVKTFTLWGSNSPTAFAELTYGTDTDWTLLTCSRSTFDQHAAADIADPKYIGVTNMTAYRYYALKIADNWGNATYTALRRIELQTALARVSYEGHALTHNWPPRIIGFDAPTVAMPTNHGGYAQLTFGSISFNPLLFAGDWPPPTQFPILIYHTETDEASRELVFEGMAYLTPGFTREEVSYALYGPTFTQTIAASTAYNDTLNAVLTTVLTSLTGITAVNTTYARVSSPNVTHTVTDQVLAIDLASAIAEFYSHLFYIVGSTAYLVDMKLSNGTDRTLTEFEFFAFPGYQYNPPLSAVRCGTYAVFSTYPFGAEQSIDAYHTTEANILTALADILAIENSPRIVFDIPMEAGRFPVPGKKMILPDTANMADLLSWIRVRKIGYDFIGQSINIEGEGVIAAA